MKTYHFFLAICILTCSGGPLGLAQDDYEDYGPQPQRAKDVHRQDVENADKFGDNSDVLVLPGVVANRHDGRVEITVESTGVSGGDAAEFLVVHTSSFHGYEALLWSHAMPSDIHRALKFIGLKPGGPRDPSQLRFWGKGARLTALVSEGNEQEAIPLENMLYDREKEQVLPQRGFIFTGSMKVAAPGDKGGTVYAADHYPPKSVISAFNDPNAVLDVGWQISKQEAYRSYAPNPETGMEANQLYTLIIEPDSENGEPSTKDLTLTIKNPATFILTESESGKRVTPESTISAALEMCRKMVQNGVTPYVTLHFNEDMILQEIQGICRGMAMLDQPAGLRIEPPQPGRLYYKSFIPNPEWRDPSKRQTQIWEIHIEQQNGEMNGTMVFHEPVWGKDDFEPEFKTRTFPVPNGKAVRERLDEDAAERQQSDKRQPPPVLLVYAPANLSYGKLLDFLRPALKTHNTVHLFLEQDAK